MPLERQDSAKEFWIGNLVFPALDEPVSISPVGEPLGSTGALVVRIVAVIVWDNRGDVEFSSADSVGAMVEGKPEPAKTTSIDGEAVLNALDAAPKTLGSTSVVVTPTFEELQL